MKQERDLINEILLRASERGHRLFRQNTGKGWVGTSTPVPQTPGSANTIIVRNARPLIAGLCVGSSDIIGWTSGGRFVALEVKTPGVRTSKEQAAFIKAAHASGCIAEVVFSADEALALLP